MTRLVFVGDIHGKIDLMLEKALELGPEIIVQLGDFDTFVSEEKLDKATRKHGGLGNFPDYYSGKKQFPIPVYFIKGNHEDFDVIEEIKKGKVPNLHYLDNGKVYKFGYHKIGAIGGNYSPVRFKLARTHCKLQGVRRRHFNYEDISDLIKKKHIDILIGHDCPKGTGMFSRNDQECGAEEIRELVRKVQPKYYFHGHYHRRAEAKIGSTKVVCLDKIDGKQQSLFLMDV